MLPFSGLFGHHIRSLLRDRSRLAISDERAKFPACTGVPLRFIPPQLASSVDEPPEGEHSIHEIKHDGYRCQVLLERGRVRVLTRNGHDWTDRYPSIILAAADLPCKSAIIDGEAVVQDDNGVSDFGALLLSHAVAAPYRCSFCVRSDAPHGRDLRQQPLSVRRSILKALIGTDDESRIQFSDGFEGDGKALFKACAQHGLEGIVSKHAPHPIAAAGPILGSRPSASPNRVSWLSAQIATPRPEHSGLC